MDMQPRRIGWTIGEGALSGGIGLPLVNAIVDFLRDILPASAPDSTWPLLTMLLGAVLVGTVAGTSKAVRRRTGPAQTTSGNDFNKEDNGGPV